MHRRSFLAGFVAFAAPLAAEAQPAGTVYRVAVIYHYPGHSPYTEALRDGLRQIGYVDGQNLALDVRSANGKPERYAEFAADLTTRKVDVIVTAGAAPTLGMRKSIKSVPIVMVLVADPVSLGIVRSWARPGGNVTGRSLLTPDMVPKSLEILKETSPNMAHVAFFSDATNPGQLKESYRAEDRAAFDTSLKSRGLIEQRILVTSAMDLHAGAVRALREKTDASYPQAKEPHATRGAGAVCIRRRG